MGLGQIEVNSGNLLREQKRDRAEGDGADWGRTQKGAARVGKGGKEETRGRKRGRDKRGKEWMARRLRG